MLLLLCAHKLHAVERQFIMFVPVGNPCLEVPAKPSVSGLLSGCGAATAHFPVSQLELQAALEILTLK